jgi:hypothetical protein
MKIDNRALNIAMSEAIQYFSLLLLIYFSYTPFAVFIIKQLFKSTYSRKYAMHIALRIEARLRLLSFLLIMTGRY